MSDVARILEELPYLSDAELASVRDAAVGLLARLGSDGLTSDERSAVSGGDLMRCVKLIRERTGLGLRDAKAYMDRARGVSP